MSEKTVWTRFMDMYSGGGTKEPPYEFIYIEAPLYEAEVIFYNRFGHNPSRVTCTCCGDDYSINEEQDLSQATAFERNCKYDSKKKAYVEELKEPHYGGKYQPIDDYIKNDNVLVIYRDQITPDERKGDVPEQGYVWQD